MPSGETMKMKTAPGDLSLVDASGTRFRLSERAGDHPQPDEVVAALRAQQRPPSQPSAIGPPSGGAP